MLKNFFVRLITRWHVVMGLVLVLSFVAGVGTPFIVIAVMVGRVGLEGFNYLMEHNMDVLVEGSVLISAFLALMMFCTSWNAQRLEHHESFPGRFSNVRMLAMCCSILTSFNLVSILLVANSELARIPALLVVSMIGFSSSIITVVGAYACFAAWTMVTRDMIVRSFLPKS